MDGVRRMVGSLPRLTVRPWHDPRLCRPPDSRLLFLLLPALLLISGAVVGTTDLGRPRSSSDPDRSAALVQPGSTVENEAAQPETAPAEPAAAPASDDGLVAGDGIVTESARRPSPTSRERPSTARSSARPPSV